MAINVLDPIRYGRLCAEIIPKAIENDEEFDRLVAQMEALDFKEDPTPEDEALSATLAVLIQDYDDRHHELPEAPPDAVIRVLMEQRGLKQADLLGVFGSRSVASDVINGKREPSKAHIRKLAEFFRVTPAAFL
jgi:HTH-type transcriptional regulator / antitoxin HigA